MGQDLVRVRVHRWEYSISEKKQELKQCCLNSERAKVFNLNFHPLEVVFRYRDPQLQVGEITILCILRQTFSNRVAFIPNNCNITC